MRALPTDVDLALHVNNGQYFGLFDLGRFDAMVRTGLWDEIRRRGWTPVVQAEQIAFRARDCGIDITYDGIRLTPEQIVAAALAEEPGAAATVDAIGNLRIRP